MQSKTVSSPDRFRRALSKRKSAEFIWLASLIFTSAVHAAGITINPADSPANMAGVIADLDCDDLVINGTLDITGATFTRVGNVVIGAEGVVNANDANIQFSRGWADTGSFNGAGSTVAISNSCANTSTNISGNTTFYNLTATVPGHTLNMAAGSEQQVAGLLTLNGVQLLGQTGTSYMTLLPGGTQNIGAVGVNQVDATHGQHLAPTQLNQIAGGIAPNWFQVVSTPPVVTPVPAQGPLGLALMSLLLCAAAFVQRHSTKRR